MFRFLKKKEETEEQLIERWASILITHANYKGEVERKSFTLDYVFEDLPSVEEQQKWLNHPARKIREEVIKKSIIIKPNYVEITHTLVDHLEKVKNFLLDERYIQEPAITKNHWELTERGVLAKELGGHKEYKKYRKSEIELVTNQGFINNVLIGATLLAAIMPFIAAWVFSTKVYNTNVLPAPVYRPDIRIDSVWLRQQVFDELKKIESNRQHRPTTSDTMPK